MLRDDFQRGLEALRPFDLSYDLLILPRHLSTACQLVRRFPDQRFALDHIAKPHIRDGLVQPWADDLRRLAAFPNVYCKVSGLITEAHWQDWAQPELRPYLDIVFDSFGPERIMFGSDWPVCTLAGTYGQVADVVDSYVSGLSESERAAVWGGNAARFYGLG
jgi:L-fuconolactonase